MDHSKVIVGYLVPLKDNLEENTSISKLHLFDGSNTIGRDMISISDKRVSREHIILTTSGDGCINLAVVGTNPVVVISRNQRKMVSRGEEVAINGGDIIELIPCHHRFKFVVAGNYDDDSSPPTAQKRASEMVSTQFGDLCQKKMRASVETMAEVQDELKDEDETSNQQEVEAIRDFHIPSDKLPLTFRLLRVKGLPSWANTSCVSITDVIQGEIIFAILSNYMVDMEWLTSACPLLAKVAHVLVIHGEGDETVEHMKINKPSNWILHKPKLPISFGTHHSKAMLLVYRLGVRIVVHTANLIHIDWNNKSQGLWMQDFPLKKEKETYMKCEFENDLVDYLNALKWPEFDVTFPFGTFKGNPSLFKKFDYSNAMVRLIASVPGYHVGVNLKKWGHMKLQNVLQECAFDKEFEKSPLVYQFSSLGSLDEKWMAELATSMSAGILEDRTPLGHGEPKIIWPTVEDVRCSIEGYAAGNAIPSPQKNVEKEFLKKYWAKWRASHTGRCHAMPHIKTFARHNGEKLAWLLLTSANLSKAAWGALQKGNSQLMVRSYELGVLFLPARIRPGGFGFSCTSNGILPEGSKVPSKWRRTKLATLKWLETADSSAEVVRLPVPYELPPQAYSSNDIPWSWDRRYTKKDAHGQVWPRHLQLFASKD